MFEPAVPRPPVRRFGQRAVAPAAPGAGRALVVDLAGGAIDARWWRGATTLALLVAAAIGLGPGLDPLPGGRLALDEPVAREWTASGVGAARTGTASGLRRAAGDNVEAVASAPERARIDQYLTLAPGEPIERALLRLGAGFADGRAVAALAAGYRPAADSGIRLVLGRRDGAGRRPVERLEYRSGLASAVVIARQGDGALGRTVTTRALDERPRRLTGVAGEGLYWALRSAGVPVQTVAEYLKAISDQVDVGALGPGDRFDLVLARRAAGPREEYGPLLYAGLLQADGRKVELMRWKSGGQLRWMSADALVAAPAATSGIWPVAGRISSRFGSRRHPILRFLRPHNGIDFASPSGTPIVAVADGVVSAAGWAGGYGRQVRLAHSGGLSTSYSHMSALAVAAGTRVRQGEVIGYVGSSGLSTGPHLHYEVRRGGTPVDPMGVRFAGAAPVVDPGEARAFRARMARLLASASPA